MVKLSNNVEWFKPYLNDVKHLVPIEQLEKIFGIVPKLKQIQGYHAHLVVESKGRKKRKYISMYLSYTSTVRLRPLKRVLKAFSKLDLLEHLAHELAHLIHWKHTTAHKKLEAELIIKFMTRLESIGYVSEEHEIKHKKST